MKNRINGLKDRFNKLAFSEEGFWETNRFEIGKLWVYLYQELSMVGENRL